MGVLAAARLRGVASARGVAIGVAQGRIGLQTVAAGARVAVLNTREAVIVLEAVLLANFERHLPRRRIVHACERKRRRLVGAAKIGPAIHDLAGCWD